jgi:hypothetical protein
MKEYFRSLFEPLNLAISQIQNCLPLGGRNDADRTSVHLVAFTSIERDSAALVAFLRKCMHQEVIVIGYLEFQEAGIVRIILESEQQWNWSLFVCFEGLPSSAALHVAPSLHFGSDSVPRTLTVSLHSKGKHLVLKW